MNDKIIEISEIIRKTKQQISSSNFKEAFLVINQITLNSGVSKENQLKIHLLKSFKNLCADALRKTPFSKSQDRNKPD